jgi:hypothetical protein
MNISQKIRQKREKAKAGVRERIDNVCKHEQIQPYPA